MSDVCVCASVSGVSRISPSCLSHSYPSTQHPTHSLQSLLITSVQSRMDFAMFCLLRIQYSQCLGLSRVSLGELRFGDDISFLLNKLDLGKANVLRVFVAFHICLTAYLPTCVSVCLPAYLSVCLSVYLPTRLPTYPPSYWCGSCSGGKAG